MTLLVPGAVTSPEGLTGRVAAYLGLASSDRLLVIAEQVVGLARGYTRGVGFEIAGQVPDDLGAALVTACARLYALAPKGVASKTIGDLTIEYDRAQWGWSLAERLVLDRYRVRVSGGPVTVPGVTYGGY